MSQHIDIADRLADRIAAEAATWDARFRARTVRFERGSAVQQGVVAAVAHTMASAGSDSPKRKFTPPAARIALGSGGRRGR